MGLSDANVCNPGDGISGNGSWTSNNGTVDQITTSANNPGGGVGKGFRHWVGDGTNNGGGGISVSWPSTAEMWFRYYIRFQAGFAWSGAINMKTIRPNQGGANGWYFGLHQGFVGGVIGGSSIHHASVRWADWMGGAVSDGNWHCLEVHSKLNSSPSTADGVFEFWLNGARIYSDTAVTYPSTSEGFAGSVIGGNHADPLNGQEMAVDFDDIAVSANGRIGCIGSTVFLTPKNLRVQ